MRQGNAGDTLDSGHLQNPQIGLPLVELIKRIVVGAEVLRHPALPSNGALKIRQSATPSTAPAWTPKPMIRRVYWSIRTRTQWVRNVADSHLNRSILQRLSFTWPRKVSQEGPPESCPGQW